MDLKYKSRLGSSSSSDSKFFISVGRTESSNSSDNTLVCTETNKRNCSARFETVQRQYKNHDKTVNQDAWVEHARVLVVSNRTVMHSIRRMIPSFFHNFTVFMRLTSYGERTLPMLSDVIPARIG
jgi:hypothetical protein